MNKYLFPTIVFSLISCVAWAADFSQDTSAGKSLGKDESLSVKGSKEDRSSKTKSRGSESNKSKSQRSESRRGGNSSLDASIPARALFTEEIRYKLPEDLGLAITADATGKISLTEAELLQSTAKSNARISSVTEEKPVREYLYEVAKFGAVVGQAQLNLNDDISKIGVIQRNKSGELEVTGLGADDIKTLANGAFKRAKTTITDPRIKSGLDAILNDKTPCRFAGEPSQIVCGTTALVLNTPPNLKYNGVEWYGGSYAGISGSYRASSSWSWSKALENASGSSSFDRNVADDLESQGKSVEAVMTRKKAVERSKSNKTNMSPSKFLPGHQ